MWRRGIEDPPVAVVARTGGRAAGWLTAAVFSLGVAAALLGGAAAASAGSEATDTAAGATSQSPSRHGSAAAASESRTVTGPVRRVRPAATVAAASVPAVVAEAAAPAPADCRTAGKAGCFQTRDGATAPLTAVNMVIGQLTGTVPSLTETAKIATEATSGTTPLKEISGCKATATKCPWWKAYQNPAQVYYGLEKKGWVTNEDGYSLLASTKDGKSELAPAATGFRVTGSFYPNSQFPVALKNLTSALAGGKSAIVVLTSKALSYAAEPDKYTAEWHAVTVLSVDEANSRVYINDGALPAVDQTNPGSARANLELSLADFQKYWAFNKFETAIVELKPSGAQSGSAETLDALSRDLARQYDSSPVLAAVATAPVAPFFPYDSSDTVYGKPNAAVNYWQYQVLDMPTNHKGDKLEGGRNTCVLVSSAMVIGQLTGTMPDKKDIVAVAKSTASDSYIAGDKSERGLKPSEGNIYSPEVDDFVYYVDAVKLLAKYNVSATYNFYPRSDAEWALSNLTSALGAGKSVIVSINQDTAYNLLTKEGLPAGLRLGDHAITVLGVNMTTKQVYINDSALNGVGEMQVWGGNWVDKPKGQGITMGLDDFLTAWKASSYLTLTCTLSQARAVAPQQSAIAA